MKYIGRRSLAPSSAVVLGAVAIPTYAGSIRMLSTGVGVESRVPRKDFPLLVKFAEAKGGLIADMKVSVQDQSGKTVVSTASAGPWLFLGLPAGDYKVTATRVNGRTKTVPVTAPETGRKVLHVTW